jgi:phosphatidylinositol alpha-1,6-mannosyltransferase
MRLLVVTELFLPTKGGTAVWFAEVYRRLGGKEIHIVTADAPGASEYDSLHPNTVSRLNLKRISWVKPESLLMYIKLLLKSLSLSYHYKFTAVHAGRVLPEGLVAWLVARIVRVPVVIYAHGEEITTWRQPGKLRMMRFAYCHADRVVANSGFTREKLIDLGVLPDRITIIHPGVDVNHFRPGLSTDDLRDFLGIGYQQKLILSVGRLSRRKGFDMVLRSLPELLRRGLDVHYAVIGIGEDSEYLGHLAKELEVSNRVHFLGHVLATDLPRWYNACDIFAMPNREINGDTEGFGMVFLEAAACRKPTVAGRAGGTEGAVLDGVTGVRVDGESMADVTAALNSLLTDSDLSMKMGDAAYRRVCEQFSWEVVAQRTEELAL